MTFNFVTDDEEEEPNGPTTIEVEGLEFSFSSSIPEPVKGLTDQAREKAKAVRKKKAKVRELATTFCGAFLHLVCKEMGKDCTCPCHKEGEEREFSLKDQDKRSHYTPYVPGQLTGRQRRQAEQTEGEGDITWGWASE